MRSLVAIALVFAVGCGASTPVVQYSGIREEQHVEKKKLPDPPDSEAIPKEKDWVKPLPAGKTHTEDGVLLSPEKAVRAKKWQDGYKNLRNLYELDRKVWGAQRTVYEERLGQANAEIKRRSPSWWDENKGTIAWAAGFVMGAAATVGIVYSVDQVKQ